MAEEFAVSELIVPGTYIRVRAEGLITAGGISTGNIGIVGTAVAAPGGDTAPENQERFGRTHLLSDYDSAVKTFGRYDALTSGKHNLTRSLEILFASGARTIFARAIKEGTSGFATAFNEVVKEDVNILVAPEMKTNDVVALLNGIVDKQEGEGKDMMAVAGADADKVADIKTQVKVNKRLILAAPGIQFRETLVDSAGKATAKTVTLPGNYTAAAVAGLLSSRVPQSSLTNKVLGAVPGLAKKFSYGDVKQLIGGGILVLEDRGGIRVVRGIGTEFKDKGPFQQITTRRIVDFAKAGVRQVGGPFIGRLNNQRVRKALQGAIDGFLTTMVQDEALTSYTLEVTATRADEIAGRAIVNVVLQPTFSIDFIAVTMVLE